MGKRISGPFVILLLLLLLVSCGEAPSLVVPDLPESTTVEEEGTGVVQTREPKPTATPGPVTDQVERLFGRSEITNDLLLDKADWMNLLISLLIVALGYVLGTWLVYRVLARIVRRTQRKVDDLLFHAVRSSLRWLVVVLTLRFATIRLVFLSVGIKMILSDVYFVLLLLIVVRIVWLAIGVIEKWYRAKSVEIGSEAQLAPAISWLVRLAQAIVILTAIVILLAHFGIDVLAFAAALGLTGFAISLAAKDTIADVIAGMIIMVDQPFRVGDRIEIQGEDTWGDVTDIGLRTTRIRTRDNRLVIVPNSIIGKNQVINYTFPDPRFRIQTHVNIGYGTDIKQARRIMIEAVRQVDGVLPDKPVDALYNEMDNMAMIFRVRWWIESYEDTRRMLDKVHSTLQEALDAAGIKNPNEELDVNLKVDEQDNERPKSNIGDALHES